VCVRFGFNAAPAHLNHSLTTGLIFRGRLISQFPSLFASCSQSATHTEIPPHDALFPAENHLKQQIQ